MGSILKASKTKYRVYAPSSHALPVIRCLATDVDEADICLFSFDNGLGHLKRLSLLFGKLWNDNSGALGAGLRFLMQSNKRSTFQIVWFPPNSISNH
jgi:polynucleotide 5'-hydroxyl-kinase GRC3/NOL9